MALNFSRVESIPGAPPERHQNPEKPYPYLEEEVDFADDAMLGELLVEASKIRADIEQGMMSMERLSIKITSQVSEKDWSRLMTWREHVFSPEGLGTDWIGGGMHVLASSDSEAVGHIGFDMYKLIVDGEETECIGIGAVVVVPAYQGRKIPGQMLSCLNEWRAANRPDTALALFCTKSLVRYYVQHNFATCMQDVFYIQKGKYVRSKFSFMTDRSLDGKKRIEIPSNPW